MHPLMRRRRRGKAESRTAGYLSPRLVLDLADTLSHLFWVCRGFLVFFHPALPAFFLLGCATVHHETRRSRSESRELVSRHPQCRVKYGKLPTTPTASISHSHSSTLSRVEVRPQKTSSTFLKLPSLFRQYIVELRRIGSNESICADTFCINLMANPAY